MMDWIMTIAEAATDAAVDTTFLAEGMLTLENSAFWFDEKDRFRSNALQARFVRPLEILDVFIRSLDNQ